MKFCHIVPVDYIPEHSGDFVMALANYLEPDKANAYEEAMLKSGLPIVLDNGAFETGKPDGIDNLFRKAKRIKPKYIFAPDTLFNAEQTRRGFENFEYIKEKMGHSFKTAVVVQADNIEEYLAEFKKYNEDPRVSVIGLSYLAISQSMKYKNKKAVPKKSTFDVFKHTNFTGDRIEMLKKIADLKLEKVKPLHLLGLGESYEDVKIATASYGGYCLYNDTSTCYMASKKGIVFDGSLTITGGKIREKIDIKDEKSNLVEGLLKTNIKKVKENICK